MSSTVTDRIAARLDDQIIENFADLYVMEDELQEIEQSYDLDRPEVIAALATCADIPCVQQRLIARPPARLVTGITAALARRGLRRPAVVLAEALLAGARCESAADPEPAPKQSKGKGAPPPFARATRLPRLMRPAAIASLADSEALVRALYGAEQPPDTDYTAESLAQFGRALALGWLSFGGEPAHAWAARAGGWFPDHATAIDLAMLAREIGPRVGQFAKARVLVLLADMNTATALRALYELATQVRTKSIRNRAKQACEAAAKRTGLSLHDLADKLIDTADGPDRNFVKRLEQRMVEATVMPAVEFVENILQRPAVRRRAAGIVFAAQPNNGKAATFTVADDHLVGIDGERFELAGSAHITVVHPFDLSPKQLATWRAQIVGPPFRQLDRPIHHFGSLRAMLKQANQRTGTVSQGALIGLEASGWTRGAIIAGSLYRRMERVLDGFTVIIEFTPGIAAAGGVRAQTISAVTGSGKGSARALAEIARELDTLGR